MRVAVAACLIFLASVASAQQPIVIGDDPGGQIGPYLKKYDLIKQAGTPVVLAGVCVSACTLVLELPRRQVCARQGAMLGFHGPSMKPGGPLAPMAMVRDFASLYPRGLHRYFYTTRVHWIPAARFFKACNRLT